MSSKDSKSDSEASPGLDEGEVLKAMMRAEAKEADLDNNEEADSKDGGEGDAKAEIAAPKPKLLGAALIEKVQEYFYGDDDLARLFEQFIADKSHCVDLDSTEFKLQYTSAYEEYKALFERKIGGYIEDTLGATVDDFYEALQKKSVDDEWSNEAIFAQILIGVTDFDVFMQMMREGKKGNKVSHK